MVVWDAEHQKQVGARTEGSDEWSNASLGKPNGPSTRERDHHRFDASVQGAVLKRDRTRATRRLSGWVGVRAAQGVRGWCIASMTRWAVGIEARVRGAASLRVARRQSFNESKLQLECGALSSLRFENGETMRVNSWNTNFKLMTSALLATAGLSCAGADDGLATNDADMNSVTKDADSSSEAVANGASSDADADNSTSSATATTNTGDDTDSDAAPDESGMQPGRLELVCISNCDAATDDEIATVVESLRPAEVRQAQTSAVDFDMGDIRASQEFLFLLVNPGDTDVVDLSLSSDSDMFTVKPSTIDRLPPQSEAYVLPIIRVAALHGVAVEGVGAIDLMPMGPNSATVSVSGQSQALDANSETTEVGFEALMSVEARVMDIELYDGTDVVDLANPSGSSSTNLGGLGFERFYYIGSTASMTNTGNVDIEVIFYDFNDTPTVVDELLVPDGSIAVPSTATTIGLKSNTVTDGARLQLGSDGVAYFRLEQSFGADEGKPPEELSAEQMRAEDMAAEGTASP